MNKIQIITTTIFILIILAGLGAYALRQPTVTTSQAPSGIDSAAKATASDQSFILADYPINEVPLYEVESIDAMHFFVNDDVSSTYLYDGPVNYYNVVFKTTAPRTEVFKFYQSLMDSIDGEETTEAKLVGRIGTYRVYVSQYNEGDDQVYIQAALPTEEFEKTNPYFNDYPVELVTIDPAWVEKESSYGLRNQLGGEASYSRYFVLDDSQLTDEAKDSPFEYFFNQYSDEYQDHPGFTANAEDAEQKQLSWEDGEYKVTLVFAKDHGRVYLSLTKPM